MKRFLLPLSLIISLACSQQNSKENEQSLDFTFDLDTLMVDPGDKIIYLGYGLHTSDLSKDGKYLYNFNMDEHLVEVIDLDELVLKERIPFEKEGPNGTGASWVADFQHYGGDKFLVANFMSVGFFNIAAENIGTLKLRNNPFEGDVIEEDEYVNSSGVLDEGGNTFFAIYQSGFDGKRGLAMVDIKNNRLKKIPVERLKELEKYSLVYDRGNGMMSARTPSVNLIYHQGKVMISNSAINELLVYHVEGDSVTVHPFESRLMDNSQNEVKQKNVGSGEELNKLGRERQKEVGYGQWIYDPKTDRHFRFSSQFVKETEDDLEFKVVLTVLDKDFRQVYETDRLPIKKAGKAFFKDGKIYLFENMDDELGFVVMTMKEIK
jgi:hypothetical protein